MSSKPVLGYWDIRGLAGPIRLLLHYAGVDFEDKQYSCGPGPDFDRSSWLDVKFTLGLPFPNLPYYIDGENKICQSNAILRHIARKHGLAGDDEEAKIRLDIVECQLDDFRTQFVILCYRSYDDAKDNFADKVQPIFLKGFSEYLGDRDWFGGAKLSYVDFMAYEIFDHQRAFKKDCLKAHANLVNFMKRFEELPQIKAYFSSSKYVKLPLNNKSAKFGNSTDY